ncbi:CaiB/BaiF CoA-transferase family protein [Brevibacterium picturae]|uniref:CoA transferase n=1 Tax=Brevibacterium picturae TaxID=260553 RepID=A0ABN2BY89_9MICO
MSTESTSHLPLAGITVVALEQAVAAPFATRQLADLGARVIKVERPDGGDFARGYDRTVTRESASAHTTGGSAVPSQQPLSGDEAPTLSSAFLWLNRGKESVTLDIKSEEGNAALERLIAGADVFIENLSPSAARRAGLDPTSVQARHPGVIACSVSGYGETGPMADAKAYDLLIQGETGMIALTGDGDMMAKVGISIADIAAGSYAYSSILAALLHRFRTGRVEPVRISLFDALSEWLGYPLHYALHGGIAPARRGTSHATIAPYGAFVTGDGNTILFAVQSEREWARFCDIVMADATLASDERFDSQHSRVGNAELLDEIINTRLAHLSQAEALALLKDADIAVARLNSISDLADHEQLAERGRWIDTPTPVGPVRTLLPPWAPGPPGREYGGVPRLGEHTRSVLTEFSPAVHDRTTERRAHP